MVIKLSFLWKPCTTKSGNQIGNWYRKPARPTYLDDTDVIRVTKVLSFIGHFIILLIHHKFCHLERFLVLSDYTRGTTRPDLVREGFHPNEVWTLDFSTFAQFLEARILFLDSKWGPISGLRWLQTPSLVMWSCGVMWCDGGLYKCSVGLAVGQPGEAVGPMFCGMMDSWAGNWQLLTLRHLSLSLSLSLELQYPGRIFTIIDQLSPSTKPSHDIFVVCQNAIIIILALSEPSTIFCLLQIPD